MKVQSNAIQAYARTAINPAAPAQPVAEPQVQSSTSDEAAHVTLSAEARELALQQGSMDRQKVEALRAKVESGSLKVNSQILAMRILDSFG